MTTPVPQPFGMATIAQDLNAAKAFYEGIYPFPVKEGVFAGIKFFSIMKEGNTIVSVFEKTTGNPIAGTVPVLKVDSVNAAVGQFEALGGKVIIGTSLCPCTQSNFALCADREGNQLIFKEAAAQA